MVTRMSFHNVDSKVIILSDNKYLCQLTVIYLGRVVTVLHFNRPGVFYHAKFLVKPIYNLVLCLSPQLDSNLFSASEMSHAIVFAKFVVVFNTFLFLKAPFSYTSPEIDLEAIREMEHYKIKRLDV